MRLIVLFVCLFTLGCENPLAKFNEVRATSFEKTMQLSEINYDAFMIETKDLLARATDADDKIVISNFISAVQQTKEMYDKASVDHTKVHALHAKYPKPE